VNPAAFIGSVVVKGSREGNLGAATIAAPRVGKVSLWEVAESSTSRRRWWRGRSGPVGFRTSDGRAYRMARLQRPEQSRQIIAVRIV
jgi:hypothetical protein